MNTRNTVTSFSKAIACSYLFAAVLSNVTGCAMEVSSEADEVEEGDDVALATEALARGSHAFGTVEANGALSSNQLGIRGVTHLETGRYRIQIDTGRKFQLVGFGNFQVVALGTNSNRCKMESWGAPDIKSTFINAFVRCHDLSGTLRDSRFVASWVRKDEMVSTASAYLNGGGNPATLQEFFNSSGQTASISRAAAGDYSVTLNGQALFGGTVQVTAIGTNVTHCKVSNWFPSGSAQVVRVLCFNGQNLADSKFSLNYDSLVTMPWDRGARAWASDPASASYPVTGAFSYNSGKSIAVPNPPPANTASRFGTGDYQMHHSLQPLNNSSAAHVTAYGIGSEYCKLQGWGEDFFGGTSVRSRCFSAGGSAADTRYVETFQVAAVRNPQ